ncbi:hypothetical protein Slin14017_G083330 [Septoria linicola]|nr:hypothetical protein Slin14017_G083330 [Septoria linicola]
MKLSTTAIVLFTSLATATSLAGQNLRTPNPRLFERQTQECPAPCQLENGYNCCATYAEDLQFCSQYLSLCCWNGSGYDCPCCCGGKCQTKPKAARDTESLADE